MIHTIELRAYVDVEVMPGAGGELELQEIVDISLYSRNIPRYMIVATNLDDVCSALAERHGDRLMKVLAIQLSEIPR